MDLKCKCGHGFFNVGTNGKYAMCSQCKLVYDEYGDTVTVSKINRGETIFIKNNEILSPKMHEYKPNQSLFNSDIQEY
jgi:hypothetical protein